MTHQPVSARRRQLLASALLAAAFLPLPLVGCDAQSSAPAAAVTPAANAAVEIIRLADGQTQGANPVARLGTLSMGQRRSDAFTLVNHTHTPLQLAGNASCGCTRVVFDKKSADPGERVGFTLSYNSAAKPENLGRVRQPFLLTLTPAADAKDTNDTAGEPILISGFAQCDVEPSLEVSPDGVRFERDADDPTGGQESDHTDMAVTNSSDAALAVGITETLAGTADPAGQRAFDVDPAEFELQPGETRVVLVSPTPGVGAGPVQRRLQISGRPVNTDPTSAQDSDQLRLFYRAEVVPRKDFVAVPGALQVSVTTAKGSRSDLGEIVVSPWRSERPGRVIGVESSTPALTGEIVGDGRCHVFFDPKGFNHPMAEETITLVIKTDAGASPVKTARLKVPVLILP